MSNNLNQVKQEAKEVYDSIEKIQAALSDGKITADEAGTLLQSLNTLSTDLPELAQEGKELIDTVEKEVENDLAHVQESKIYQAFSKLWAEFSMVNLANVFYAIIETVMPNEPDASTTTTSDTTTDSSLVAETSDTTTHTETAA